VIAQDCLSLAATADALNLERLRMQRLGRYLRIDPGRRCVPLEVITEARQNEDSERRYRFVLDWLLQSMRTGATAD
jgi:hypothetical protein